MGVCHGKQNTKYKDFFDYLLSRNGIGRIPIVTLEQAVTPLIPLLPNIRNYVRLAKDKCTNPSDSLTPNESASIMLYTMGWQPEEQCLYNVLNETLSLKDHEQLQPWFLYLKLFLTALTRLPSSSLTVYRENTIDLSDQYHLREKLFWWDFGLCSSTLDQLNLQGTKTMFTIECQSIKDIRKHTYLSSDYSVLILPGTKFQVIDSVKKRNDLRLITLREIQSSFLLKTRTFYNRSKICVRKYSARETNSNGLFSIRKSSSGSMKFRQITLGELIAACRSNLVNLSEQNITDRDMKFIVKNSIARRCCQRVRLPNNHITAQGALVLAKGLQENDTLELLDLRNNSIGDLGVEILVPQIIHSNLKILKLESNYITYESAHYLAEMLRKNRTLTQLYLSKNHLGDRGIELLTNALDDENNEISSMKPSTLQHLYLGENNITDVGIGYIANMLKTNRILTWLWLSNNQITTHGVELLSKVLLEDNFTLQWLFLNYNQGINDDCINTLESLFKYNYSLKTIYLYNCNLSAAAKQKLYQAVRYKTDFDLEV